VSYYKELIEEHISSASHLSKRHVHPRLLKLFEVGGMNTAFMRGEGNYLYDGDGNRYLDFLSGGGVHFIGRNHPEMKEAIEDINSMDLPNLCVVNASVLGGLLAEQLLELGGPHLSKVLYANSGTEAMDVCVRFARQATGRRRYLYLDGAFHGRSYASISMCGFEELRGSQEPLMPTCTPIPPNDINVLRRELSRGDVAAFVFEPVQGMTTTVMEEGYLREARTLCEEYGTIMIADEIQTGLGRTGTWFGCHAAGVRPDMMTVSKTLSGGEVPVSAVMMTDDVYEKVYSKVTSGPVYFSTFAENNLAMAAGLATLKVLRDMDAPKRAQEISDKLRDGLAEMAKHYDVIKKVKGKGLMCSIYFRDSAQPSLKLQQKLMGMADEGSFAAAVNMKMYTEQHVITQIPGPGLNGIKILPPVTSTDQDIDYFLAALEDTIAELYQASSGPIASLGRGVAGAALDRIKGAVPQSLKDRANARQEDAQDEGEFERPAARIPNERLFAKPTSGDYDPDELEKKRAEMREEAAEFEEEEELSVRAAEAPGE
jgi:ornithine--oxo-acid transaminase